MKNLRSSSFGNRTRRASTALAAACVTMLGACGSSDSSWLFIGGEAGSGQFSELEEINASSVNRLGLLWASDLPVAEGLVGNPLVLDGVAYQSAPRGVAIASDLKSGKTLWQFTPNFDFTGYSGQGMWAAHSTRGLGIDKDNVYVVSGCQLYAIERKKGTQRWEARVCDPSRDAGVVAAPRVGGGKIFIGSVNSEMGTDRGFAAAFDAKNGKELWRFYTVPGDPSKPFENKQMELASKTWPADHWKVTTGSASVWEGMTYDPTTNLLIFGTGNPALVGQDPSEYADRELLYSDSIVAVDASTGQYVWHFQQVSGDVWDMADAAAHIVVADLKINGRDRRVVLQAAKNGFFYVIDAKTGEFISAKNYVPVTNYEPIDPRTGKLRVRAAARYWEKPGQSIIMQPGLWGAHAWTLTSFNPKTGLVYIPAFISPSRYPMDGAHATSEKSTGRLIAWDPVKQEERWHVDQPVMTNGGTLSTAGNLVFQGSPDGRFSAYNAATGKLVWSYDTHSIILGAPSTVIVGGQQLILVPAGDGTGGVTVKVDSSTSTTPRTIVARSRLLAFALDGKKILPQAPAKKLLQPARPRQDEALAKRGRMLFVANNCVSCHGYDLNISGASHVPDLRNIREDVLATMPQIVRDGAYSSMGMPGFPHMTDEDIKGLQAYLVNAGWAAFEQQKRTAAVTTGTAPLAGAVGKSTSGK